MIYEWTEFDSDGRYIQSRSSSNPMRPSEPDSVCVKGIYNHSYYFRDNEVLPRPRMSLEISGAIISGIPSGATIKIHSSNIAEQEFTADGTDITITPEIPGIYTVKINLWPYQEEEITIEYNG